jgi:uncharacterized GH25 family protein
MKKSIGITFLVLMVCIIASSACACEFIIKPDRFTPESDSKIPFSVMTAHVFMVSDKIEAAEHVTVSLIQGKDKTLLKLQPNNTLLTLDGVAELKKNGSAIIAGHRKGMVWTETAQGWKQASKKGLSGVISSGKYEKFGKTLINTTKDDDGYSKVIGDKLEIVPLSNPALVAPGDYMDFKILFDGKPLSTEIYATYHGFTKNPNTYAYFTKSNDEGIAKVKITHPGTWMVRVPKKVDRVTKDYDVHVMRAILVFEVNALEDQSR